MQVFYQFFHDTSYNDINYQLCIFGYGTCNVVSFLPKFARVVMFLQSFVQHCHVASKKCNKHYDIPTSGWSNVDKC